MTCGVSRPLPSGSNSPHHSYSSSGRRLSASSMFSVIVHGFVLSFSAFRKPFSLSLLSPSRCVFPFSMASSTLKYTPSDSIRRR